eukprot:COSAG06_NODE_67_length_26084_cov_784.027670_18_plen_104_part_00
MYIYIKGRCPQDHLRQRHLNIYIIDIYDHYIYIYVTSGRDTSSIVCTTAEGGGGRPVFSAALPPPAADTAPCQTTLAPKMDLFQAALAPRMDLIRPGYTCHHH